MVTKLVETELAMPRCLILAKIHMVTKPPYGDKQLFRSLILAKIHMVTKLFQVYKIVD